MFPIESIFDDKLLEIEIPIKKKNYHFSEGESIM